MSNVSQRSFASGELCPALYARTDVVKYANGLKTCRNFIVQRTGGVNARPGFDFVAETRDSAAVRLIKFIFNKSQALIMEFGVGYVRFFQDGAPIVSLGSPVTVATPYTADDLDELRYVQSADVVTIVHHDHPPYNLTRLSNTSWTMAPVAFGPALDPPQNLSRSGGTVTVVGTPVYWLVTAIDATTGEESNISDHVFTLCVDGEPSATNPQYLSWDDVVGAGGYNVYRATGGGTGVDAPSLESFGLIGTATDGFFTDTGTAADYSLTPPQEFTGFSSTDNYPSVVGFYQQRKLYANTISEPEKVWCSQSGNYNNFNTSFPLQDDDAVIFALANAEVTEVRHLLDLGKLVLGTEGGEWLIEGDANGLLTPFAINPRTGSYNGANTLLPVKVGNSVLYVQSLGNKVLELKTNIYAGYYVFVGKDMGVYSTHLLDGYEIVDWDYQQIPNYTTWIVRDDGTLLGFTYLDDEELSAWHRHDTAGTFERVCTIPEGGENRVYVVVNRTINGQSRRFIERMRPLVLLDIEDACFMDSALEYDGRDQSGTVTLTGSGWTPGDPLTATGSSATAFISSQAGDAVFLRNAAGDEVRATFQTMLSNNSATVFTDVDVPADMQAVAISDWDLAVRYVGGLDHLEGEEIAVFADGLVVGSPNNPTVDAIVVTGDQADLGSAYAHIVVGLPYLSDLETLDIDTPQGPSLKESNIAITSLGLWVAGSRGIFCGREAPSEDAASAITGLRELKIRSATQTPSDPNPLVTNFVTVDISSNWNQHGRIFVRQVDPVPLNVLAAVPFGFIPAN